MKISLLHLETRLQQLVEGTVARLFPSMSRLDLASRLVEAMHAGSHSGPNSSFLAPNLYILAINPVDASSQNTQTENLEQLAHYIRETGTEAGYSFSGPVVIRIESDPKVPEGEIRVSAHDSLRDLTPTEGILVDSEETAVPRNAFLIVDGTEIVPLALQVMNIGRRSDNHLVLQDPRVSRLHAQLRAVHGAYMIFDLDSTYGTRVNGRLVHQQILKPGDVIMIGNVPLVYGQEQVGDTADLGNIEVPK
jgi:hypothetical protein